jgi:hypothetical protein
MRWRTEYVPDFAMRRRSARLLGTIPHAIRTSDRPGRGVAPAQNEERLEDRIQDFLRETRLPSLYVNGISKIAFFAMDL